MMSRAVFNLKPDALRVRDGLCHRREGQGFQIGRGQTVAVNRNPVRSAPSEAVVLAGDDDPQAEDGLLKLYSHAASILSAAKSCLTQLIVREVVEHSSY